jgi:hypothetical protein
MKTRILPIKDSISCYYHDTSSDHRGFMSYKDNSLLFDPSLPPRNSSEYCYSHLTRQENHSSTFDMKVAQFIAILAMATASLATPTPAKREANVDIESYPCELHD